MNRRQFLTGASAIAVASALPAVLPASPAIAWDLASGPDRTALWLITSTPSGENSWAYTAFYSADGWEPVEFDKFIPAWPTTDIKDIPEDCDATD